MTFWRLASESPVIQSLVVVTAGIATLVLAALLVQPWMARSHWRRMLWRAAWISASAWILAECVGGNMLVAHWLNEATGRVTAPHREVELAPMDNRVDASSASVPEPFAPVPFDDVTWDTAQPSTSYEPIDLALVLSAEVAYDDAARRGRESFSPLAPAARNSLSAKKTPDPDRYFPLFCLSALAGSIVLALWFTGRRIVVCWFTWRHTSPAPESVVELVKSSHLALRDGASSRGARRLLWRLRLVESSRLAAPVVYGALRPTLAVPTGFADSLPRDQLEAVLAHELVHVSGRDPLWQVAYDALVTLLWWHPLVWLARAKHRAACEAAADAGAAALYGGSRALAAALLRLARQATGPRLGWAALDGRGKCRSRLGRRVLRLLREDGANRNPVSRRGVILSSAAVCALITSLLLGTALARCQVSELAFPKGEDPMTIWQTSWRSSLAAAAVAAMLGTSYADEEVAVEVELVLDAAAEATEGALEALLGLEPQIELLLTSEEEEEEEEEVIEEEAEEDEADEEGEEEDEGEEDESDKPAAKAKEGILSKLAKAKQVAAAQAESKQALVAKEIAMAKQELAKAQAQLARERDQMAKQLKQALAQAQEQAAQGGQEAAQKVMQQLRQIQKLHPDARVQHLEKMLFPGGPVVKFTNDADRRRHHLIQAAENLRVIGKNDLAEELMREAESIKIDQPSEDERPGRAEVRIERRGPAEVRDRPRVELRLREQEERDRGNADELRAEMNELRSQMNDMRAMLERVVERLENQSPSAPR